MRTRVRSRWPDLMLAVTTLCLLVGWVSIREMQPARGFLMFGDFDSPRLLDILMGSLVASTITLVILELVRARAEVTGFIRAAMTAAAAVSGLLGFIVVAVCLLSYATQPTREVIRSPNGEGLFVLQHAEGPLPASDDTYLRLYKRQGNQAFVDTHVNLPRANSRSFARYGYRAQLSGPNLSLRYRSSDGDIVVVRLPVED